LLSCYHFVFLGPLSLISCISASDMVPLVPTLCLSRNQDGHI
jgi:hypothetical protein